ncbi:MAG: cysteine desulfurase-like protein [Candidatus Eisenbacteria bacterium]|nr:cysteine desulfurase-like protein [Candidatus Eisenbacteria bacterium]
MSETRHGHFEAALLDHARAAFPALASPWALFDNAGGSVPLAGVIERVRHYMSAHAVQLGAGYELSVRATSEVAAGHRAAELLLGAEPGEVALGSSTTINLKTLARALRPLFGPGDEVIITDLDHESNIGPWRELAADGVRVLEWGYSAATGALDASDLDALLSSRTRLVCFTHCSNVVGSIHDTAAIIRRVHEAGALACVDGVAVAPHRLVDVKALDADFYAVSLYKVYGPHLGMLYGRRDCLLRAKSQNHFFFGEDELPCKLEPGGPAHELAASLPAIPEYLLGLESRLPGGGNGTDRERLARAFGAIAAHEEALAAPLLEWLGSRAGVRVIGEPGADRAGRVPTIAFTVDGRDSAAIPAALDSGKVAIRFGHFYARRAIERMGLLERNGIVRVSMAHYNTPAEVDRLIAALDLALGR